MDDDEVVEVKHRKFANGDVYIGGWRGGLPAGNGKYLWKDTSCYEGGWKEGAKHGIGKYTWPSGATYQGEWLNGCMHGVGTFEAPDHSRYQGGWARDLKHGLGKKIYANGDIYEGLWKDGKPEGPGRYVWADGNEYDGEWRNGRMHGQGTFVWKTAERYDGEWKDGQQDGLGVFTSAAGATYDGFWQHGKKHGLGVFRVPPQEHKRTHSAVLDETSAMDSVAEDSPSPSASPSASPAVEVPSANGELPLSPPKHQATDLHHPPGYPSALGKGQAMQIKEYSHGKLLRQSALDPVDLAVIFGGSLKNKEDHRYQKLLRSGPRIRHGTMGEQIVKGTRSYDLMLNLQLGIRYSVSRINQEPLPRELSEADFKLKVKQEFPRAGSTMTPVHPSNDFEWKDYVPMVFRKLRETFNMSASDYIQSLCGDRALREINKSATASKSGSLFLLSDDERFIIKTMKHSEMKLLFRLMHMYYRHVTKYPHSLLVRFYGLHRITPANGRSVRFIVMANMFRTDLQIHRKYDLKGSWVGRTCGPIDKDTPNIILKDRDLDVSFKVEEGWHDRLLKQLKDDCALLEGCEVIDYSLLLGVHFRSRGSGNVIPPTLKEGLEYMDSYTTSERPQNFDEYTGEEDAQRELKRIEDRIVRLRLGEQQTADLLELARLKMLGTRPRKTPRSPTLVLAMRPKRSETLRPVAYSQGATDEIAQSLGMTRVQLGLNVAATAIYGDGSKPAEDVVLYFGIIDILTTYDTDKKIEHALKSVWYPRNTMSAVDPHAYAKRFLKFMQRVFV